MSEKKLGKRLLTWVLVLVMTLSTLPLNVLADWGSRPGRPGGDQGSTTQGSPTVTFIPGDMANCTVYYVINGERSSTLTAFTGELSVTKATDSIVFYVATSSNKYALTEITQVWDDSDSLEDGDFFPLSTLSSYAGYDDAVSKRCVAGFRYSPSGYNQSVEKVKLNFYAQQLATLEKTIVGYYREGNIISESDVGVGDVIKYRLTVNYYDVNRINYTNVKVTDGLVGYDSTGKNDFTGKKSSESVDVEYTVKESDLNTTIRNTAKLEYSYNATFNSARGSDTDEASVAVVIKNTVSYKYTGDVPTGITTPEGVPYAPNELVSVYYPESVPGYTFNGWTITCVDQVTPTTGADGKIVSFTMPNHSVTLTGHWTANPDTKYKVEHYQQNLENDEYTLEETDSDLAGMTGALTAAQAKNYEGFTAQSFTQETIAADGSTLVKIYYNRNSYKVTYQYTEPVPTDATTLPTEEEYKYGAEVTVADAATATGYTFNGWNKAESFTMPAKDVTITGSWTPIKYDYTINYVDKDTNKTLDTVSGTADFKSTLTLDSVKKDITGYNYDSADKNFLTIGITETDNVITLYYTKDTASYTVNYYWNGTTNPVHDSKTVSGKTIGSTVTEVPISIANCTPVSNSSQEISISSSGENVIIFYYYKNVELTANSATLTYNGEEQSVSGFTGAPDEVNFSDITVGATGTNAGSYDAKFPDGTVGKVDSTAKYIITAAKDGKLVISPYAGEITVKVTGKIESKVYDGTVQTVSGYDVEITGGDGLYTADNVTYRSDTPSVSGTNVEGSPYEMNLKGTDFDYESPNFTNLKIIVTGGSLTITPREVTLTSGSDKKVYDGTALTKDEVIATGFVGSDSATYTVTGSIINAGKAANSFTYELTDDTIASNYTIKQEYGELEIIPVTEKVTVTIKGNTKSVTYNGSEQSVSGYEITFDNQLYKKEYVKLTGDAVAKGTNRGTYYMGLAAEKFENINDNFTNVAFEVTDGKLEITRRPVTPPSRPTTPTIEIDDDDALGLNTTDHFAYIVGYGNGEVRPQNNITRAEVATIFFRLLTDDVRDENLTKTNSYSDVAATAWYNTAVSTLSSMGIITGYPDGTFRPNAAITRAEFAAIAARFDPNGDKTAAAFIDIASHWAKDEISIAYNNGWITGYPDGTFGPQRDITRAETMTLVNRVLNRLPETEDDLLPNMTVWTDNANTKAWYYLAVQEATNSHYYEFKTNSQYEKWTELRETRDWTLLEK